MIFVLLFAVLQVKAQSHTEKEPHYHDADVEASKEYVEGNAYQKDLLLYVDMLGDTHPYYADTKHRAELNKCAKRLYRECSKIKDVAEFKLLVARLAASLNDGHTSIFYWTSPNKIFPVRVTLGGGVSAVVDVCSQELSEPLYCFFRWCHMLKSLNTVETSRMPTAIAPAMASVCVPFSVKSVISPRTK